MSINYKKKNRKTKYLKQIKKKNRTSKNIKRTSKNINRTSKNIKRTKKYNKYVLKGGNYDMLDAGEEPILVENEKQGFVIRGLIMCVAVVLTYNDKGIIKYIAGHFVTPSMFNEDTLELTKKGKDFINKIKSLLISNNWDISKVKIELEHDPEALSTRFGSHILKVKDILFNEFKDFQSKTIKPMNDSGIMTRIVHKEKKTISCRICNGNHLTFKCPHKNK